MIDIDEQCRIEREELQGYFNQYWRHSSVLRNWFVAYGIGALALVIYKNGEFFATSNQKRLFVLFIVLAISLQVILTFLNKLVHWFIYCGKNLKAYQTTKRYRWSDKISECFLIDIAVDVLTIICYAGAFIVFVRNL